MGSPMSSRKKRQQLGGILGGNIRQNKMDQRRKGMTEQYLNVNKSRSPTKYKDNSTKVKGWNENKLKRGKSKKRRNTMKNKFGKFQNAKKIEIFERNKSLSNVMTDNMMSRKKSKQVVSSSKNDISLNQNNTEDMRVFNSRKSRPSNDHPIRNFMSFTVA